LRVIDASVAGFTRPPLAERRLWQIGEITAGIKELDSGEALSEKQAEEPPYIVPYRVNGDVVQIIHDTGQRPAMA